jgi:Arc/MetJ-type ribon-helix-helix transcriptional regulator
MITSDWCSTVAKPQICVTLEKEYREWLEKKVRNKVYGSLSHAVTVLIRNEMKKEGLIKDE